MSCVNTKNQNKQKIEKYLNNSFKILSLTVHLRTKVHHTRQDINGKKNIIYEFKYKKFPVLVLSRLVLEFGNKFDYS